MGYAGLAVADFTPQPGAPSRAITRSTGAERAGAPQSFIAQILNNRMALNLSQSQDAKGQGQ